MMIGSCVRDGLGTVAPRVRARGVSLLLAAMSVLVFAGVPAVALGEVYKWLDERGKTVFSDVPPAKVDSAQKLELVAKDSRLSTYPPVPGPTPTERALLARIENLERQLQARQNTAASAVYTLPGPYGNAYPTTPSIVPGDYYADYPRAYAYPVSRPRVVVYPVATYVSRPVYVAPRVVEYPRVVEHPRGGAHHRAGVQHTRR